MPRVGSCRIEHARIGDETATEKDLLLVAARQRAEPVAQPADPGVQTRDLGARFPLDRAAPKESGDGEFRQRGRYDVLGDVHRQEAAGAAPIGGHEEHPSPDRGFRV